MKRVIKTVSNICVWLVVVAAVGIMIFTVISVYTFDRSDREIFGYSALVVMSDSMSKTDFDAGDIILIKKVDPATLRKGDIIAYESQDSSNKGETVTHKIRRLTVNAIGEPGFITYGTTTDTDDEVVVTYSDILGKYEMRIPNVGTFFHFLKTPIGYILCILIPFMVILFLQGSYSLKLYRQYKAEKVDAIKEERLALEEERKKTEEKMKELQELKAQLQGSEDTGSEVTD